MLTIQLTQDRAGYIANNLAPMATAYFGLLNRLKDCPNNTPAFSIEATPQEVVAVWDTIGNKANKYFFEINDEISDALEVQMEAGLKPSGDSLQSIAMAIMTKPATVVELAGKGDWHWLAVEVIKRRMERNGIVAAEIAAGWDFLNRQ